MSIEVSGVTIKNNTSLAREALAEATNLALETIGTKAEKYVKENMTNDDPDAIDTGRLRNSMTHIVEGNSVYVGTNMGNEYGVYVELGTGIYASNGNGRKEPWVYFDKKTKKFRFTRGIKPHHMIRRAVTEHTDEYREIVKKIFKDFE